MEKKREKKSSSLERVHPKMGENSSGSEERIRAVVHGTKRKSKIFIRVRSSL
jgi:hypothetical protein